MAVPAPVTKQISAQHLVHSGSWPPRPGTDRARQRGVALVAMLVTAVILIGALAYLIAGGSTPGQALNNRNVAMQLVAQAQYIRQRIHRCAIENPAGDNGTGYHPAYPGGGNVPVASITCPGTGASIWNGSDGATAPSPPTGFSGSWYYSNGSTATIWIAADKPSDSAAAITLAQSMIGSNEAVTSGAPAAILFVGIAQ